MDNNRKMFLEVVGKRLRIARMKKGLTQVDLAKMVGYSDSSTIHKIEKGLQDIPASKIKKFCQILDVDFDYFRGNMDYVYSDNGIGIFIERQSTDLKRSVLVSELTSLIKKASDEQLSDIIGIAKIYLGGDD